MFFFEFQKGQYYKKNMTTFESTLTLYKLDMYTDKPLIYLHTYI